MHREGAFHADAEADLADGEGLPDTRPLPADHRALEHLDPFPVAFNDSDVDLEGVARTEAGDVVTEALAVYDVGWVHGGADLVSLGGDTGYPCSESNRTSSSVSPPRAAMRSGRRSRVRASAAARRQRATRPWSPLRRTSGTGHP